MKNVNYKKLILPNIPYVFIGLLATKLGQAARLSPGVDFSSKAMNIMQGTLRFFPQSRRSRPWEYAWLNPSTLRIFCISLTAPRS